VVSKLGKILGDRRYDLEKLSLLTLSPKLYRV
jgi:hypothetical protein